MKYVILSIGFLLAMGIISAPVGAKDLGVVGKTYPIKERDALQEIEERAKKVDWKKEVSKIKPERYRPEGSVNLPKATKNSLFLVDMTYTLDMDIPDGKGGILYPKGYTFNPLDYIPFRKMLVVINGSDKDQIAWFKKSPYISRPDVMLLLTEGSYSKLGQTLGRPVFYSDSRIVDKFQLKAVPSVIEQAGRMMQVREINVPKAP